MLFEGGAVDDFGDAEYFDQPGTVRGGARFVGLAPTRSGKGYWATATDGGVFSLGDATFYGSMGGVPLRAPVAGIEAFPLT
jgi:hypothetical protein